MTLLAAGFLGPLVTSTLGNIVLLAAGLAAAAALWRMARKPAQIAQTLTEIAAEFKPDHGSSLRDVIDANSLGLSNAAALAKAAADAAKEAHEVAVRASDRIEESVTTTREEFAYLHNRNHDFMAQLTRIEGQTAIMMRELVRRREDFPEGGTP